VASVEGHYRYTPVIIVSILSNILFAVLKVLTLVQIAVSAYQRVLTTMLSATIVEDAAQPPNIHTWRKESIGVMLSSSQGRYQTPVAFFSLSFSGLFFWVYLGEIKCYKMASVTRSHGSAKAAHLGSGPKTEIENTGV